MTAMESRTHEGDRARMADLRNVSDDTKSIARAIINGTLTLIAAREEPKARAEMEQMIDALDEACITLAAEDRDADLTLTAAGGSVVTSFRKAGHIMPTARDHAKLLVQTYIKQRLETRHAQWSHARAEVFHS